MTNLQITEVISGDTVKSRWTTALKSRWKGGGGAKMYRRSYGVYDLRAMLLAFRADYYDLYQGSCGRRKSMAGGGSKERVAELQIHKSELTERPAVRITVPAGTEFEDLGRVQEILFSDVLDRIGLSRCPGCLSGLDRVIIEESFQDVIRVQF